MYQMEFHRASVDSMNPMLPAWHGAFARTVQVGEHTRRFLYYAPDGAMASTAGVMLLPPSGMSAEEFLIRSNWKNLSESEECKEKFILCILEADGGWRTDETYADPTGDAAYVDAVYRLFRQRTMFSVHEAKIYLVGYGAGAAAAQRAALSEPTHYAGLACVSSPPIDPDFRAQAGNDLCVDLHGFSDPTARLKLRKRDIPLPVWMIASDAVGDSECWSDVREWCVRNGAVLRRGRVAPDTIAFEREADPEAPTNQDKEAYRVWCSVIPGAQENLGELVNRRIWKDFLYRVRRWRSEPGGSLRITQDPIRDLGCEYHYELVGGWMREWYVYIPESVRKNLFKTAPLVFAFHGYSCTGETYLGDSGWNRVADHHGFIVVAPTAPFDTIDDPQRFQNIPLPAWNIFGKSDRPNEILFFRYMLEDLQARFHIDNERIYATGHSWGSMMTQYLGLALPDTFAAIATCSGVMFDRADEAMLHNPQIVKTPRSDLPIWMFVGEMEKQYFPHLPADENAPARNIRLWWKRNGFEGSAPETFEDGWSQSGRWHDLTYRKDRQPILRYTWVEYLPHATMPEMSERIWCEFFSCLHKEPATGIVRWK